MVAAAAAMSVVAAVAVSAGLLGLPRDVREIIGSFLLPRAPLAPEAAAAAAAAGRVYVSADAVGPGRADERYIGTMSLMVRAPNGTMVHPTDGGG